MTQCKNDSLREEASFGFEELFFSRTDEKGLILSGNSVFQRISGYKWEELRRKPHNLIRHPDMPKAVFWLLWDTIKKGAPIGAYVKNKAKDGRYYWVFAIVTPIDEEFLSVRLKPSSSLFKLVEKEYASIRSLEIESRLKADESATIFLSRLQELGFRDYSTFMSAALSQEIAARNAERGREKDSCIAHFEKLVSLSQKLLDHAANIFGAYRGSEHVSTNLQIQSARLGSQGTPISTIASNYTDISLEAKESMTLVMDFGQKVADTINEGLFLIGTARTQEEILEFFEREATSDIASHEQEITYLRQQQDAYAQKAIEGLNAISLRVAQFQQTCAGMRKLTLGLKITSMMGKIESSRLSTLDSNLDGLIEYLDVFQNSIQISLNEMYQINHDIQITIDRSINNSLKTQICNLIHSKSQDNRAMVSGVPRAPS